MAHPDDSQRALNAAPPDALAEPALPPLPPSLAPRTIALVSIAAVVACLAVYLALAVPGRWLPSAPERSFSAAQLTMPRGAAAMTGNELIVTRSAEDGNTVISVTTDLWAVDYPVIAWIAAGFPADAHVALLWQTDVEPARVNRRSLEVEAGLLLPADLHRDPHWLGRIVGLALVVQGRVDAPLRVRGVIAKPAGALDTLRDRVREWLAPEPWTGASINTVAGGSDVQRLPLPLLLSCATTLIALTAWLLLRTRGRDWIPGVASAAIAVALVAWFVLDARWTVNLVREAQATASRYAGKDADEKHLAGDDRELFAFIDKARTVLPPTPARIFVMAGADYFRARAAYHLYPHNVWYTPNRNDGPPAGKLRPGDWLLVYQRRGIQYDSARHSLRWENGATVPAELKLLDRGAALFVVQ